MMAVAVCRARSSRLIRQQRPSGGLTPKIDFFVQVSLSHSCRM